MSKNELAAAVKIARAVKKAGGQTYIVGGYVRDLVRSQTNKSIKSKDIDLEVFGLEKPALLKLLKKVGPVNEVGKSFAVFKVAGLDVSLPRIDIKTGPGHQGFTVEEDPGLDFSEAASRRDFTINTLGYDPLTKKIIDPFGGINDLKCKVIRATSPDVFSEDPLRVLRALQFAVRFEFDLDPVTARHARRAKLSELSTERVTDELVKALSLSRGPSLMFDLCKELGIAKKLFPELMSITGKKLTHLKSVIDESSKLTFRLALIVHFLPAPKQASFLKKLKIAEIEKRTVMSLAQNTKLLVKLKTDADYRKLAVKILPANLQELISFFNLLTGHSHTKFQTRARKLGILTSPPIPFLQGRDLIKLGVKPGPAVGRYLRKMYQKQLAGEVKTRAQALKALKQTIKPKTH